MIQKFPLPPNNTGIGMHDTANAYALPSQYPNDFFTELKDLQVSWYKFLVKGTNKVGLCQQAKALGIEPIVRFYEYQPGGWYRVTREEVAAYAAAGVIYFESNNEPNLIDEWPGNVIPQNAIAQTCQQWMDNTDIILQAAPDSVSLFPALAPGGNYSHFGFYENVLLWFFDERYPERGDWFRPRAFAGDIAFAIHNRPINHPLDYPFDPVNVAEKGNKAQLDADGTTSFNMYLWLDQRIRHYLGYSLPLLGTEAGYEPYDIPNDPRYPAVSEAVHAEGNIEICRRMDSTHPSAWAPVLFCQCFWLWNNLGHETFKQVAWRDNQHYGRDMLAVQRLYGIPVIKRNYQAIREEKPMPETNKKLAVLEWINASDSDQYTIERFVNTDDPQRPIMKTAFATHIKTLTGSDDVYAYGWFDAPTGSAEIADVVNQMAGMRQQLEVMAARSPFR